MDYPTYLRHCLDHPQMLEKIGGYQTNHLFGKRPYSNSYLSEAIEQKNYCCFPYLVSMMPVFIWKGLFRITLETHRL